MTTLWLYTTLISALNELMEILSAFFIVPVNTTTVQAAVKPYQLVPLPTSDATLFPHGFPAGYHPVLVSIDYGADIRMSVLQISSLNQGSILVPNVDRLGDGKSSFIYSVRSYVGGTNGSPLAPIVPAAVGTVVGTTIFAATFSPFTAPYQQENASPAEYTAQIKDTVLPNDISGPSVTLEAVDTDFFTTQSSLYTNHTFHSLLNQPLIQNNQVACQRNPIYFNQTFTNPIFRTGTVTLYSPAGAFPGVYTGVAGYSASGIQLGYNAESCQNAFDNTDLKAQA